MRFPLAWLVLFSFYGAPWVQGLAVPGDEEDEGGDLDPLLGQFEACTFEGPSLALPSDALLYPSCDGGDNLTYFVPVSQASACLSSFELDPFNVSQYLQSLMDLTSDYYVFTDVAVDPLASVPDTTPLNYPIYNGTGYGQVDLITEMTLLYDQVNATAEAGERVSLDIFSQVNEIYAKLHDAHVSINYNLNTAGMLDNRMVLIVSEEFLAPVLAGEAPGAVQLSVPFPALEDEEGFVLLANITTNETSEVKTVAQIGGLDTMSFLTDLVLQSTGIEGQALKSLGPRIQSLLQTIVIGLPLYFGSTGGKPGNFLKDSYEVTYGDGTTTTWYMMQSVPCPVADNLSKEDIEQNLQQPGALYQNYQAALNVFSAPLPAGGANFTEPPEESPAKRSRRIRRSLQEGSANTTDDDEDGMFQMFGPVGIAVMDDYAIYKLNTFDDPLDENALMSGWIAVTEQAAAKGVTKLMVDIIGNGGGRVDLGYMMANLMYPNAEWNDFGNPYDQVYSPALQVYWEEVEPLLSVLEVFYVNSVLPDALESLVTDLNADPDGLVFKLQAAVQGLEALLALVPGYSTTASREAAKLILASVSDRDPPSIAQAEITLMLQQIWSTLSSLGAPGDTTAIFALSNTDSVERIRGGLVGNYSSELYFFSPNDGVLSDTNTFDAVKFPFQFQQYLLLADGNGVGSTANTFQTTVSLYAKSNVGSVPPLDLVSYGGTGKKEDSAVTQFAGGSVQDANLSPLYIPDLLLYVLAVMLADISYELGDTSIEFGDNITEVLFKFDDSIPDPCYYCDEPPGVTVYEMYSVLVGANSTPMEYVDQIPDHYLAQWPFATHFFNPGDLPSLYEMASAFFDEQTPVAHEEDDGDVPITTEVIKSANTNGANSKEKSPEIATEAIYLMTSGGLGQNNHAFLWNTAAVTVFGFFWCFM